MNIHVFPTLHRESKLVNVSVGRCVCARAPVGVRARARALLACHVWVGVTAHARACEGTERRWL